MKFEQLNALSDEALVHQEMTWQDILMSSLLRHRLGKLVNTSVLKQLRRDIARAQTLLTVRETAAGLSRGALKASHRASWQRPLPSKEDTAGTGFLKSLLDESAEAR
jgi:ribosomal protein L29